VDPHPTHAQSENKRTTCRANAEVHDSVKRVAVCLSHARQKLSRRVSYVRGRSTRCDERGNVCFRRIFGQEVPQLVAEYDFCKRQKNSATQILREDHEAAGDGDVLLSNAILYRDYRNLEAQASEA